MIIVHYTWSPDWCLPSAVNLILNLSDVRWIPTMGWHDDSTEQNNTKDFWSYRFEWYLKKQHVKVGNYTVIYAKQ